MSKGQSRNRRSTTTTRRRAARVPAIRDAQSTSSTTTGSANQAGYAAPILTVAIPTITFVRYANIGYQHVNGAATPGHLTLEQFGTAVRTAEALEATGAVKVQIVDLGHLTV